MTARTPLVFVGNKTLPLAPEDTVAGRLYHGTRTITGTSDTPTAVDARCLLKTTNAAAVAVSLPSSGFTALDVFDLYQEGDGAVTIQAGAGATLIPAGPHVLRTKGSGMSAVYLGSATWWVIGDFTGGSFQPLDATLTALAGLTTAAGFGIYSTGEDAFAQYTLTAGGRALGGAAGTANTFPYFSAANTVSLQACSTSGRALTNIGGTSGSAPYLSGTNTWSLAATSAGGRALWNAGTANTIPMFAAANTLAQVAHNTNSYTYTPTAVAGTNASAATSNVCRYIRMGNVVFVSGSVSVTATASATQTVVNIPLPVASNLANSHELSGVCCSNSSPVSAGVVLGDTANDRAVLTFQAAATGAQLVTFNFSYTVI